MFVYLDNGATTRPHQEVTKRVAEMMEKEYGNPSSLHSMGVAAEKSIKGARKAAAFSLGVEENEVYFTSGGTEGNNTAIFGAVEAKRKRGNKIITSKSEHAAVLEACRHLEEVGFKVIYLDVDGKGGVSPIELENVLDDDTILVSLMAVNNELGTIAPLPDFSKLIRAKSNALFHCDAVQAYGKIPFSPIDEGVDMAVISAHKVHGPKGIGAIYIAGDVTIRPLIYGGGQEKGFRSGTENVPGIVGFGVAAEHISSQKGEVTSFLASLRRRLLNGLREEIKDIRINSHEWALGEKDGGLCSPAILNVSFLGCPGEALLHSLEQSDIYISTGSACSSRKKGSHVLAAAGLTGEEIASAIRFSIGEYNREEEMDYVVDCVKAAVKRIRKVTRYKGER